MDVRLLAWAGYELKITTSGTGEDIHHHHAICEPDITTDYVGNKHLIAQPAEAPHINIQDLRPGRIRAFPVPD